MPRDERAEASVLGAAMLSRDAAAEVVELLTAADFYVPRHGTIFDAVQALVARSDAVDSITVTDELLRVGAMEKIGGPAIVYELTSQVPTAANVGYYVDIVRERAVLRRLLAAGDQIAADAVKGEGSVDVLVERARGVVDSVSGRTVRQVSMIGDGLSATLRGLRDGTESMMPTQWSKLNSFIGGLRPGALYVIGARPGVGKTVAGLNLATAAAENVLVGYASLEMSEDELRKRVLASEASVHLSGLLDARLSSSDWEAITEADARIRGLRLSVLENADSLSRVVSFARTLHRMGGLGLLVVDYLQLMRGDGRAESRQIEVSEFSRTLKQLAMELQIPVVALSQLNRESAGRKGGEPRISDLRESGSLEQDSDVVILLHRDEERRPAQMQMIVAKNRHGRPGESKLSFEGRFARVTEVPWDPTALLN